MKPNNAQVELDVDPNITIVGGPFPNVTFSLSSKFGNTKFNGTLELTYHELKDRYKLRVNNTGNFQEIKLNVANKVEKKGELNINVLVF